MEATLCKINITSAELKSEIMFPLENSEKKIKQAYLFVCLYEVVKYQK